MIAVPVTGYMMSKEKEVKVFNKLIHGEVGLIRTYFFCFLIKNKNKC